MQFSSDVYIYFRFDPDRVRQEWLAGDRLIQRKGRKLKLSEEDTTSALPKRDNMADLQLDVIREVARRHALEREVPNEIILSFYKLCLCHVY